MIPVMNLAQENVMYTKILVPLDGSESSMRGLSEAIKIAAEHAGEIRLLHVVEVPSPLLDYGYSQGDCRSAVLASLCRVGKNILSKAESAVREHGLTAGCSLFESGSSSTSDIILEQASVMGAHTPSARGRIGRISSDVISESGIPVLMVHGAPTIMTSAGHREVTYDFAPAAEPGA
jgi:nucleotide-binding universal stress UspA family protein